MRPAINSNSVLLKHGIPRKSLIYSIVLLSVTFAICFVMLSVTFTPEKYDLKAGDIAEETIIAPRDITDTVRTNELKDEAENAVTPVYKRDDETSRTILLNVTDYFEAVSDVRAYAEQLYIESALNTPDSEIWTDETEEFVPADADWDKLIDETAMNKMKTMLPLDFSKEDIVKIASLTETQVNDLKDIVYAMIENELNKGIREEFVDEQKYLLNMQLLNSESIGESERKIGVAAVNAYLASNMVYDAQTTESMRMQARANVAPEMYKQGENIIRQGEEITPAELAVLKDLGLLTDGASDIELYLGVLIMLAMVLGVYGIYIKNFDTGLIRSPKKMLLLAIMTVLILAMTIGLSHIDTRISPVFFGVMLTAILISPKTAISWGAAITIIAGAASGFSEGIFSETMLLTLLTVSAGSIAAVFILLKPQHRTALILSGFVAGVAVVFVYVARGLVGLQPFSDILVDCAWGMGSGVVGGMLAVGTLPIWEAVFRIATPMKLLELSNSNHPLMKRMMMEAPGTYHHSMITANLAEAACDAIGANALLARVGAYYHDVGKIKNPIYFNENQNNIQNPHDAMLPEKSVKIIKNHVPFGREYAEKYKLPKEIIDIIVSHHGDTPVVYFYQKAKDNGQAPGIDEYRYHGKRPQTKEQAAVLLADTVEAAVRAKGEATKEEIHELVYKHIKAKYDDGQLDVSPINQKELNMIAEAFLKVLEGMFHGRVKYPDVDVNGNGA